MGIYISGMDMPKEGQLLYIDIYPDGKVAHDFDLECKQIATAYQVPEHGRLVDADNLCKVLKALAADEWNQGTAPFSWAYAYDCMADTVDTMPTVIPKEEEP